MLLLGFVLRGELAASCVTVRVTNGHSRTVHRAVGPATLYADVRVRPDPAHRRLEVRWGHPLDIERHRSLGDASVSSPDQNAPPDPLLEENPAAGNEGAYEKDLDGADERVLHQATLTNLAGGTYDIVASVYRDREKRDLCNRARTRVVVMGDQP